LPKVCEHINLPVQAGDDAVLSRMRRPYNQAEYRELVQQIRDTVPGVSLSTDIIVGFPGETEEQYQRSLELVSDLCFDKVHCAAYSTRPGTIASRTMEDDIPQEEKVRRMKELDQLQEDILGEINASLVEQEVEVLIDGYKKGKWQGRTRTDKLVFFQGDGNWLGQLVKVKIEKASPWSLQGVPVVP
jgi:tRNA-2-methylthio-N6-dimethylallyladenosine synthase